MLVLLTLLVLMPGQATNKISDQQKQEFIMLLQSLPTKGEFYTAESVEKARTYLPVLFALTDSDIAKFDFYPFLAISRGLCDLRENREYAVRNFATIKHPKIKLFWAAMLFDSNQKNTDIMRFLRNALESQELTSMLKEAMGPRFQPFRKRVLAQTKMPEK